ncbi:hypothetical protein [Legionella fairfieldensis]|uniref:hypothetical protein n=1 Tax=Legionella fairfieldensis TaxID=45064 RepID=UPI0004920093|nr:hypothetical protein [Legionella fairfieldensis]
MYKMINIISNFIKGNIMRIRNFDSEDFNQFREDISDLKEQATKLQAEITELVNTWRAFEQSNRPSKPMSMQEADDIAASYSSKSIYPDYKTYKTIKRHYEEEYQVYLTKRKEKHIPDLEKKIETLQQENFDIETTIGIMQK